MQNPRRSTREKKPSSRFSDIQEFIGSNKKSLKHDSKKSSSKLDSSCCSTQKLQVNINFEKTTQIGVNYQPNPSNLTKSQVPTLQNEKNEETRNINANSQGPNGSCLFQKVSSSSNNEKFTTTTLKSQEQFNSSSRLATKSSEITKTLPNSPEQKTLLSDSKAERKSVPKKCTVANPKRKQDDKDEEDNENCEGIPKKKRKIAKKNATKEDKKNLAKKKRREAILKIFQKEKPLKFTQDNQIHQIDASTPFKSTKSSKEEQIFDLFEKYVLVDKWLNHIHEDSNQYRLFRLEMHQNFEKLNEQEKLAIKKMATERKNRKKEKIKEKRARAKFHSEETIPEEDIEEEVEESNEESNEENTKKTKTQKQTPAKKSKTNNFEADHASFLEEDISMSQTEKEHLCQQNFADWKEKNSFQNIPEEKIDISRDEIQKYLVICCLMALKKEPDYQFHWNNQNTLFGRFYGTPLIRKLMPLKRFQEIHRYFHYDIHTMQDCVNESIKNQNFYQHNNFLSVDESLIACRCFCSFLQYMKDKPAKIGLKVFAVADSLGYLLSFFFYQGKLGDHPKIPFEIVKKLLEDINILDEKEKTNEENQHSAEILRKEDQKTIEIEQTEHFTTESQNTNQNMNIPTQKEIESSGKAPNFRLSPQQPMEIEEEMDAEEIFADEDTSESGDDEKETSSWKLEKEFEDEQDDWDFEYEYDEDDDPDDLDYEFDDSEDEDDTNEDEYENSFQKSKIVVENIDKSQKENEKLTQTVKNSEKKHENYIFLDNWYGSYRLATFLHERGVFYVLNCRQDRPTALFKEWMMDDIKPLHSETVRYHKTENILAFGKHDRKKCFFFTNKFSPTKVTNKNRNTKRYTTKNELIYYYNKGMGGVDTADQMMKIFMPFPHKKNKFTRILFFSFLKIMLDNSFIISRIAFDPKLSLREFVEIILDQWMKKLGVEDNTVEFPKSIPYLNHVQTNSPLVTYCAHCKSKGIRSNCTYCCPACKVNLHGKCFGPFHEKKYKKKQL